MKTLKKSVSILLSIIMILSVFTIVPLTAHAASTFNVSTTTIVDLTNYITVTNNKDGTITAHMPNLSSSKVTLSGTNYSLHYGYEIVSSTAVKNQIGSNVIDKAWRDHTAFSSQNQTIDIKNWNTHTALIIAGHPSNGACLAPGDEKYWGYYLYPNPVQITYNLNGGNIGGSTANKTEYLKSGDTLATTFSTPQRTNYFFKGWYTAASGGSKVTASNATEAKTYYAQWETRTVTLNGGNNATRSGGSVNQEIWGTAMTTVKYTANSGYAFKQSDFPKSSNGITATWKSDTTVEVAGTPTVSSVSLTVPDAKPRASITAPTANVLTYNGSSRNLVSAGSASGGTMYYAVTTANTMPAASSYSTTIPKGTNAGTYYVWYKAVGDANHTDTSAVSVTVTVNKAEVTAPTISSKTYNAQAQTADVTASSLYSVTTNDGGTNAGSYDVVLTLTDAANYKWTDSTEAAKTLTFTITKAIPVATAPTANDLTYNKADQALVSGAATTGGTMMYKILEKGETVAAPSTTTGELEDYDFSAYSEDVSEAMNAGTYTVAYGVKGDSNYFDVAPQTVEVEIKKATPYVELKTKTRYYNKNWQELVLDADVYIGDEKTDVCDEAKIWYSLEGGLNELDYSPVGREIGTYDVYTRIEALSDNLNAVVYNEDVFTPVDIKAGPTVTMSDYTYGDADSFTAPEVEGNVGEGEVTYKYYPADGDAADAVVWDDSTTELTLDAGDYKMYAVIAESDTAVVVTTEAVDFTVEVKTADEPTIGLSYDEIDYSGEANEPTVTVKDGEVVISPDEYEVSYSDNTDAGTATVTITDKDGGNYTVSGTKTFVIKKAPINPTVTVAGWTYGDEANEPVVTGNTGEGAETITYKRQGDTNLAYTAEVPVNAGTYTVKLVIAETDNYLGKTVTSDFTIAKADITPTVTIEGWTFGADANDPSVTGNTGNGDVTYTYAVKDSDEFTADVPENAGEYTVKAVIAETANYNGAETTADFTIAEADITPTVTLEGWTYGEEANEPEVTGNTGEGEVTYTYAVKDSDEFTSEVPTEAGDYTVKAVIAATANYDGGEATADFTIAKADITPTVTIVGWTYGDEANDPSVTGNTGNGEVTYTYAVKDSEEFTSDVPENAGDYTVKAVIAETDNYNDGEATADFTIAKADITPTVTIEGWTYGEDANEPEVTGNTGEGEVTYTYAVKDSEEFTSDVPENAGEYTVKAVIAATDNYNGAEATADFTIAKEDIDPAVTIEGWTYGDEANEPEVTGNTENGDVTYLYKKQGDTDLAYTADVPVNAGDYTVKAIVATTTNYLSGSATADFTIEKKDPEMGEGKDFNIVALELLYNDLLQNLITEYVKEDSGLVIRYSFYPEGMNPQIAGNIPRAKAIGEYDIYYMVEGTNNYNDVPWTEVPLTATIEQETFEVTIEDWTYGEDANDPVAEANFTDYTEFTYTYAVKGSEEFTAEVPENVGEYTVKASITSDNAYYSTLTATADFTIAKADITPTVTIEGWTYGEEANEPEVTGNTGEGEVTITYAVKDSDEFTADVPENAGDYTVKAEIAETDSYNDAEATADFTIAKADFEPTVTIEGWTYGEDANEPEVTGNTSEGEVTYTYAAKGSEEFTADVPENAGDYTVKAVIAETDNYNSAEATADFTIAKADITPNVTVEGWTYGDEANEPEVTGNTENGDVTYLYKVKDADDETYTDERPENAGDYTVKAVVAETADYNGAEATADFTITKAAIDPEIILDDWAYSDEANDPSINEGGNPGNGDVEYTYTFKGSDAYSAKKPVYPGTYNVKAVVAETDNYLGTTVYKDFVIKKSTFEPTVTLEGWLYGEEPNEPELTGNISEGAVKFTYAPEGSDAFSATVPTTPGSYVVKATIASTDLYDVVEVTAAFEIGQITITWKNDDGTVIDTTSVAYGETPTHEDPTKAEDDDYTYEFAGWTPEIVAATADAEYTATFDSTPKHEAGYYVVGTMTEWKIDDAYLLTANTEEVGDEFMLNNVAFTDIDAIKVVKYEAGQDWTWYPSGTGNDYAITADGTYDIYFRPKADGGDDWYEHVILAVRQAPAASTAVIDAINALPTEVTIEDKDTIEAARAAYDALNDDEKSFIDEDTYKKLTDAETALAAAEKAAADQAAADAVVDAFNALPTEVTVDDKDTIEAARAAYDALTDDQKALIDEDTYKKLTDAETALAAAEKAAADQTAADAVVDAFNALPTEVTVDDKDTIEAARAAYDALNDDQKALIDEDTYKKLTDAETALAAAEKAAADQTAADAVVDAFNALPTEVTVDDKDTIEAARAAYDALTDDQKALIDDETLAKLTDAETALAAAEKAAADQAAADAVVDAFNALPTEVTVADKDAIEAARAAYDALNDDQKALIDEDTMKKLTDAETALAAAEKAAADQAAADAVVDAFNALPTEVTVDDKDTIEAARAAYDALTDDQKALIDEDTYKKLTDAEDAYEALPILGDADGDGVITILDATLIQRYLADYTVKDPDRVATLGNVSGGGISIIDATLIQRYLAGYTVNYLIGSKMNIA